MAENNNTVNDLVEVKVDKYDMHEKWTKDIASKYLDVDDISNLKVGLYGYLNEIIATNLRYSVAHRNFLYDEAFLNTASLTKSIYNKAKTYNYDIPLATPATFKVQFSIRSTSIFEFGTREKELVGGEYVNTGNYTFTISEWNKFFIDKYPFMLEDDIIIKATKLKDGTYAYSATFDRSKRTDGKGIFSGSTRPYVLLWVDRATTVNNYDIITLQFPVYQINKEIVNFSNFNNDVSSDLFFDQTYSDYLCHFDVWYKTQSVETLMVKYFNDIYTPDDDYYYYYNFDGNILNIYFSALPGAFKPAMNSKLILYMYTTLGEECNITYNGGVSHSFNNSDWNSKIPVQVIKVTDPHGGVDALTKAEIKNNLIEEFLTRNNLVTQYDLDCFFNNLIKKEVVNSSEITFIKKRDDVKKRTYAAFLLLRDKSGLIIPSNTIDLDLSPLNIEEEFNIQCGSLVGYDETEYVLLDNNTKKLIKENIDDKIIHPELVGIFISKNPDKLIYTKNDELDLEGLEVSGIYDNNTIDILPKEIYTITGFDSSEAGINTLNIYYANNEEIYTILNLYVIDDPRDIISSVSIKEPTKTQYKLGENLDLTGMEIKVTYTNGDSRILSPTEYEISGFSPNRPGNQVITVSVEYININFSIYMAKEPNLTNIEILSLPDKIDYYEGDNLDLTGLIIKGVFDDGSVSIIDLENIVIESISEVVDNKSTVNLSYTYKNRTYRLSFEVNNYPLVVEYIYIEHIPNTIFYDVDNNTLNTSGMEIKAHYNNGTDSILDSEEYYTNGINLNINGIQDVIIYLKDDSNINTKFKVYYDNGESSEGGGDDSGDEPVTPDEPIYIPVFITTVTILHNLDNTIYNIGEDINLNGLVFLVTLSDGSTDEVSAVDSNIIATYDNTKAGKQRVELEYAGYKTFTTVYFEDNDSSEDEDETPRVILNDISIISYPNKTLYSLGEELNLDGFRLGAVYSDGTIEDITDYTVNSSPIFDSNTEGYYTISVTYGHYERNFIVRVADVPSSIYIKTFPNKTIYNVNKTESETLPEDENTPVLDATRITMNDGVAYVEPSSKESDEEYEEFDPSNYNEDDLFYDSNTQIYYILKSGSLQFYSTNAAERNRIINRIRNDELDLTGLVVHGLYKDGRDIPIEIDESKDVDLSEFSLEETGTTYVTINKFNRIVTITFVVIDVDEDSILNEEFSSLSIGGNRKRKAVNNYTSSLDPTRAIVSTEKTIYEDEDTDEDEIIVKYDYGRTYKFDGDDREFIKYSPDFESFKDKLTFINKSTYRLIDNVSYYRNDERELLIYTPEIDEIFTSDDYNIIVPDSEIITIGTTSYIPTKYQSIYETKYQINKDEYKAENDEKYPFSKLNFNMVKTTVYVQLDEETKELLEVIEESYNNEVYINYNYNPPMSCIVYRDEYVSIKDQLKFVESSYNCVLIKDIVTYVEYNQAAERLINGDYDRIYYFDDSLVPYVKFIDKYRAYKSYLNFMDRAENEIIKYIVFDNETEQLLKDNDYDLSDVAIYKNDKGIKYIQYLDEYSEFADRFTFIDVEYKLNYLKPEEDYNLVYRLPYAMHYKKDPFPRILTIRNNMNTNLYFNFSYYNANIISQYIIESINIERSSITYDRLVSDNLEYNEDKKLDSRTTIITNGYIEKKTIITYDENENVLTNNTYSRVTNDINKYFLSFYLDTNALADFKTAIESQLAELDDLTEYVFKTQEDFYKYLLENDIIKCRCILKNNKKESLGYFDFVCDDYASLKFHYELVTNNNMDSANRLCLVNCVYDISKENAGTLLEHFYLEENTYLEICVINKIIDKENEPPFVMTYPLNYCTDINNGDYTLAVKFISNIPFRFFTVMNDIIAPIVDMKQSVNYIDQEKGFRVKGLPVIGKHYLYNYTVFQDFFSLFSLYYDTLEENFAKLENNTSVNMKFYNTYGYSDHWSSNSTNITLELRIKLVDSYTTDLDFRIKNYILDFVEKVNKTTSQIFAISNLIKGLEREFADIKYIEYVSLDGTEDQVVTNDAPAIQDMTREQLINYVPEYLNITIGKDAYIEGKNNFVTGISIKYI